MFGCFARRFASRTRSWIISSVFCVNVSNRSIWCFSAHAVLLTTSLNYFSGESTLLSLLPSFLHVIVECFMHLSHCLGVVRLSVRLSHLWAVSKRCKLGSRNLHWALPERLWFIATKFCALVRGDSPQTRAWKRGTPFKRCYFCCYWLLECENGCR